MQLHLVIEDSDEVTPTTCWFVFRRCLNLRTITVDGRDWSVDELTSMPHVAIALSK